MQDLLEHGVSKKRKQSKTKQALTPRLIIRLTEEKKFELA